MASQGEVARELAAPVGETEKPLVGESRWPPLLALTVFIVLNVGLRLWLPGEVLVGVPWVLPTIELVTLIVLFVGNPSDLTKPRSWARPLALVAVGLLVVGALWATALLIYHLITGAEVTESPGMLLAAASLVYIGNNISFALLYWLIDSGGPLARARGDHRYRDYAFTQHMSPEPPARLAAGLCRLLPPGLHQRHRVQPDRRDAAHAQGEVHDARPLDHRAGALRPGRRESGQRLRLDPLTASRHEFVAECQGRFASRALATQGSSRTAASRSA